MGKIEQYNKIEESWNAHSKLFGDNWSGSDYQLQLLKLCDGQIDIAKVVDFHLGEQSINWMNTKVPALDNLKPIECFNHEDLILKLKECLMGFIS